MKILVFGATGSQQFNVIGEAKRKGAEVIAATSSEITSGIEAIALLIPVSLPNPLDGLQYAQNIIDSAKANGVNKIVWNASSWLPPHKLGIPGEDVKIDIRDYLKYSGVNYVIIEPTIYGKYDGTVLCSVCKEGKEITLPYSGSYAYRLDSLSGC